jgi:hypothetical protein
MEFIQSIDFTLVGIVLCILYETVGKPFNTYYMAVTKSNLKAEDVGSGTCLLGLFYVVFIIAMLWNPVLWVPALGLILLGLVTGGASRPAAMAIKELLASGMNEQAQPVYHQKNVLRTYFTIDKVLSLGIMAWMMYLHLSVLGIIA